MQSSLLYKVQVRIKGKTIDMETNLPDYYAKYLAQERNTAENELRRNYSTEATKFGWPHSGPHYTAVKMTAEASEGKDGFSLNDLKDRVLNQKFTKKQIGWAAIGTIIYQATVGIASAYNKGIKNSSRGRRI